MVLHKSRQSIFSFIQGSYNILMVFLILSYIFRPCGYDILYDGIWKFFLVGSMIFAIFKGRHSLFVRTSALILGIPSIIFSGLTGFDDSDFVVTGIVFSTVLFFAVCVVSILKDVLLEARVTLETLRGIVCVYFLFAFLFAYIFLFIELMNPGSLLIRGEILAVLPNVTSYFCEMLYFSFVTLLTIGFGDIVAAKNLSQTAAVIEGIVGQLYIVMLMGRFISVYSFRSNGKS